MLNEKQQQQLLSKIKNKIPSNSQTMYAKLCIAVVKGKAIKRSGENNNL